MTTKKIMVIRHAEKPDGEAGVMPDGTRNSEALTPTGWKRAHALVGLFDPPGGAFSDVRFARPAALFASGSASLRPRQTLEPLAEALRLTIDTTVLKGQEKRLVDIARSTDGVVLICWQHEAIPKIGTLIRGSADGLPAVWPGHRFDLVWVFDRQTGDVWSLAQAPELVLPGDSDKPIA